MYTVAVRELCEFTAKAGDLDLRFTPAPTALEGMAGHATVAARRGAHYQSELTLTGDYGPLHVRGRADGFDAARGCLEEVKTFKGRLERQPASHRALHWAQAKIYGWLLCQSRQLDALQIAAAAKGCLLVVLMRTTPRDVVKRTTLALKGAKVNLAGAVLNNRDNPLAR